MELNGLVEHRTKELGLASVNHVTEKHGVRLEIIKTTNTIFYNLIIYINIHVFCFFHCVLQYYKNIKIFYRKLFNNFLVHYY